MARSMVKPDVFMRTALTIDDDRAGLLKRHQRDQAAFMDIAPRRSTILPDVNVLFHAHEPIRRLTRARRWWD